MPALSNSGTGYPSSDKPWLKYYTDEAKNLVLSDTSMYQYILEKNIMEECNQRGGFCFFEWNLK